MDIIFFLIIFDFFQICGIPCVFYHYILIAKRHVQPITSWYLLLFFLPHYKFFGKKKSYGFGAKTSPLGEDSSSQKCTFGITRLKVLIEHYTLIFIEDIEASVFVCTELGRW